MSRDDSGGGDAPSSEFDPVAFCERAVRTPSHEDVGEMRDLLVETLSANGVDPTVDEAGNVLAARGDGRPHVVLNTHVDTVPPGLPVEREGSVLRGRGACDAKGPLAALVAAFLAVDPAGGRVTLAVTPDEETASAGAAALSLSADGYVVGEPTGLDACNAARGRFQATVELTGAPAHAATPSDGVNAVRAVGDAIAALSTFDDREDRPDPHPDLGAPTLVPTTVEGGEATNQVAAAASVVVDRRPVPPESADGFAEALADHVRGAVPDDVGVAVDLAERAGPFLEAWETPADDPLVEAMQAAGAGDVRPFGAATEASYFAADAPTVVFGPGDLADGDGAVAHSEREYVDLREVERAASVVSDAVEARLQY